MVFNLLKKDSGKKPKEEKNQNFERIKVEEGTTETKRSSTDKESVNMENLSKRPSQDLSKKRMSVYDEIKLTLPPPPEDEIPDHVKEKEESEKKKVGNLVNLYQFKNLEKEKTKEIIKDIGLEFAKWLDYALSSQNPILCFNSDPKKPNYEFGIQSDGFVYVTFVLEKNSNINTLILRDQEITDSGMKDVAEFLEKNTSLTSLDLSKSNFFINLC